MSENHGLLNGLRVLDLTDDKGDSGDWQARELKAPDHGALAKTARWGASRNGHDGRGKEDSWKIAKSGVLQLKW
jgi:hypothetical protein